MAARYGRAHAALVASGGAAIELALMAAGVGPSDDVLVPSIGCYKIAGAVTRSGARPIFVPVGRDLVLSPAAVEAAMTPRVRAVMAVHEYGLPCPVGQLRSAIRRGTVIIEDVAQAWGTRTEGSPVGSEGDFIVTSFGPTKPVAVGAGGALLSDDHAIERAVDSGEADQRQLAQVPLLAPFPAPLLPRLPNAFDRADATVALRRAFADTIQPVLESWGFQPWSGRPGDAPTWSRIPVWLPRHLEQTAARDALTAVGIRTQLPHAVPLARLPMFAGTTSQTAGRYVDNNHDDGLLLLEPGETPSIEELMQALRPVGRATS